jgi:hypothetical protein
VAKLNFCFGDEAGEVGGYGRFVNNLAKAQDALLRAHLQNVFLSVKNMECRAPEGKLKTIGPASFYA